MKSDYDIDLAEADHLPVMFYSECDHHKDALEIENKLWETVDDENSADLPPDLQKYLDDYQDWYEETHFYCDDGDFYTCDDCMYGIMCSDCSIYLDDTCWPCEFYRLTQENVEHVLAEPNDPTFPKTLEPPLLPATVASSPTATKEAL